METPPPHFDTGLQDIVTLVERESARMGHYYLGVEHLFAALTRIEGGVTVSALNQLRLSGRFVRQSLRYATGRGDNKRYWPAFRPTPRYQRVMARAAALAAARGATPVGERDLLLAILDERESIPVRVLTHLGVDLPHMVAIVAGWAEAAEPRQPVIPVAGAVLSDDERRLLSHMFRSYASLEIEREFAGFSGARVLLVCPIKTDGRADAALVVKMDHGHSIRYEKVRYDSYVKTTLPPVTARIPDPPVVLDPPNIGGLKYTFVGQKDATRTQTLLEYVRENGPATLGSIIGGQVYATFGRGWWQQRQPYRFNLWQEYEHVLPPALIVDLDPALEASDKALVSDKALAPDGGWSRDGSVRAGDRVMLDGFTIYRVYPGEDRITVVGGNGPDASARAHKVVVRGVARGTASQGERVHRLVGRVAQTRDDILHARVRAAFPDLDPDALTVTPLPGMGPLSNPLAFYRRLLDRPVSGTLSTIHGDLHLGNIVVDPGGGAWLIDFRWSRDGHTLFDWAVLEVSILADVIAPLVAADIEPAVAMVAALNDNRSVPPTGNAALHAAGSALARVRQVALECLASPSDWVEYHAALCMCALRTLDWPTVTASAKRLLFVTAALALIKTQQAAAGKSDDVTQVITDTGSQEGYESTP